MNICLGYDVYDDSRICLILFIKLCRKALSDSANISIVMLILFHHMTQSSLSNTIYLRYHTLVIFTL